MFSNTLKHCCLRLLDHWTPFWRTWRCARSHWRKKKRKRLLGDVGLAGRERESIKKYSKGMLQRLGLAQALRLVIHPRTETLKEHNPDPQ